MGGISFEIEGVVGAGETAEALGSGEVAVFATPRLIAWLEAATVTALDGRLSPGSTTVGTSIDVRHRAPSLIGDVVIRAHLVRHQGPRVEFAVEAELATDERLADGSAIRAIVQRARFPGGL